jgi:hypothetical protein
MQLQRCTMPKTTVQSLLHSWLGLSRSQVNLGVRKTHSVGSKTASHSSCSVPRFQGSGKTIALIRLSVFCIGDAAPICTNRFVVVSFGTLPACREDRLKIGSLHRSPSQQFSHPQGELSPNQPPDRWQTAIITTTSRGRSRLFRFPGFSPGFTCNLDREFR